MIIFQNKSSKFWKLLFTTSRSLKRRLQIASSAQQTQTRTRNQQTSDAFTWKITEVDYKIVHIKYKHKPKWLIVAALVSIEPVP